MAARNTLEEQAHLPWFSALEFGLEGNAELVRRLRLTVWAPQFFAHFGESPDNAVIVDQLAEALAAFLREDPRLHPYDSKFDQVAAGREALQRRGAPRPRRVPRSGARQLRELPSGYFHRWQPPLFTDFRYAAQGLPRNAAIPANPIPPTSIWACAARSARTCAAHASCAACSARPACATPRRARAIFHNGVFHSLGEVVDFYNTRDANPARWYPKIGRFRAGLQRPAGSAARQCHACSTLRHRTWRHAADECARGRGPRMLPRNADRWARGWRETAA